MYHKVLLIEVVGVIVDVLLLLLALVTFLASGQDFCVP